MLIEFAGESVQDSSNIAVNPARLINCYRELVIGQGKTQHVLQSVMGQDGIDGIGANPVRAMGRGNGVNWLAGAGRLYEMSDTGALTDRAAIADDANTTIGGNYSDVTVVAGGNYYVWDGTTISEPANLTFSEVGSHTYVGGYTVLSERNGKRFQWSGLADAPTLDALHFSSAEKVDDNILRVVEVQGSLLALCERSSELWQVTGQAGTEAFAYVTSWNRGLRSFNLVTKFDDTLLFVGNDNNVYLGLGGGAVDITTPGLNTALTSDDPTHCFYYEDRGHKFCVVRFSDRPAWVYDVKMQEWHERAEGAGDTAWRAVASVRGASWLVGNSDGEVLSLTRSNKDLNGPLRRRAISRPLYLGSKKFVVNKVEINARVGANTLNSAVDFGLAVGDGFMLSVGGGFGLKVDAVDAEERDAIMTLYETKDGGRTWGGAKRRSMGKSGDFDKRMIWRARGQANQYAIRVDIDEPADIPVNTLAVVDVT